VVGDEAEDGPDLPGAAAVTRVDREHRGRLGLGGGRLPVAGEEPDQGERAVVARQRPRRAQRFAPPTAVGQRPPGALGLVGVHQRQAEVQVRGGPHRGRHLAGALDRRLARPHGGVEIEPERGQPAPDAPRCRSADRVARSRRGGARFARVARRTGKVERPQSGGRRRGTQASPTEPVPVVDADGLLDLHHGVGRPAPDEERVGHRGVQRGGHGCLR
jgi:hypothetical protein